jgi:hypothetical protein
MKKLSVFLTAIALLVDFVMVLSVTLNLTWVRSYAAGGQYTTFPGSVRFMYVFQVGFVVAVAWFLWKVKDGLKSHSDSNFALAVICIYAISAASQLFSKSAHERLNFIPAAIIMWGFYSLRKESQVK